MKITHKFKTVIQDTTDLVYIITACEEEIDCRLGSLEFARTSVDWEDVTCEKCLKDKK